jgi:YihY family inner membrane protein
MGLSPRSLMRRVDGFQQRHSFLGFPLAVRKKFSDDQAGNLAALIAYYGFVSIFPLLLVFITILGIVLRDNPELQQKVLNSALTEFPVIGQQLKANVHSLNRTGAGFVAGLVGTFLGARGVTGAVQNAMNVVWEVPRYQRPGFLFKQVRGFGLIGVIGVGVLATTALSGLGTWGGRVLGVGGSITAIAVSLVVNMGLFWLGLRLATAPQVATRDLRNGAILAAVVWQVLQTLGVYFVTHSLRHASSLYGTFGLVLGLLAWLYLQAQLTLYAVEADVVRARRLWPRSLFPPPLTEEDHQAYAEYRAADVRWPPAENVEAAANGGSDGRDGSGGSAQSEGERTAGSG